MKHRPRKKVRLLALQRVFVLLLVIPFLSEPIFAFAQSVPPTSSDTAPPTSSTTDTSTNPPAPAATDAVAPMPAAAPDQTPPAAQTEQIDPATQQAPSSAMTSNAALGSLGGATPSQDAISSKFYSETDPVSGSLSYRFPIQIPAGRNGVQPNINLTYTSQQSDLINTFGYGWNASIPYIQRINKTGTDSLYNQSYFYSSLDGELYQTAASSTTYGAKIESGNFNQYQIASSTWTVTSKSGLTYTFGTSTLSRVDNPSNSNQIYRWMLEKVQDANGNYVTYQYTKDKGVIYPSQITYTNSSTTPGTYEVDFIKTQRNDVATSSAYGFPVTENYLISHVYIKFNGSLIHDYALTYGTGVNTVRSLLNSITESGYSNGATTTLRATAFSYRLTNKAWTISQTYSVPITFDSSSYLADINGDSLTDIVKTGSTSSSTIYLNTGTNWAASTTMSVASSSIVQFIDVNGDNLADQISTTTSYLNTGVGWTASSSWNLPAANIGDQYSRILDINGDGLPDIIRNDGTNQNVYINNGYG